MSLKSELTSCTSLGATSRHPCTAPEEWGSRLEPGALQVKACEDRQCEGIDCVWGTPDPQTRERKVDPVFRAGWRRRTCCPVRWWRVGDECSRRLLASSILIPYFSGMSYYAQTPKPADHFNPLQNANHGPKRKPQNTQQLEPSRLRWEEWSACTCTCGGGIKRRNRVIAAGDPGQNGLSPDLESGKFSSKGPLRSLVIHPEVLTQSDCR